MEGVRKERKARKRWRYEVQEDLNITGISRRKAMVRDRRGWREIVLVAKVHKVLRC